MSKTHTDASTAELQKLVREGRAVFVVGTGVSIAASYDPTKKKPHPQASWVGLLQNGLEWLKDKTLMDADEADAHLQLLQKNPKTSRLIAIAEDITEGMGSVGSKHLKDWLKETVGSIKAFDRQVLDALDAIRINGNLLATTNYDCLLLGNPVTLTPVTWKDSSELIKTVRDRDTSKVIYLHGHWRQPDSVVLDWNSYEQIARDEEYRGKLAAFWMTNTWVYVGCGMNGISDPDLGLLLERYAERARNDGHFDYCLVRSDQLHEFEAFFKTNKLNIRAVSYGSKHDDLAPFLNSLLPPPASAPASVASPVALPVLTPPAHLTPAIPKPPAFYAEPDYIGSHKFVGRTAELQTLSDWAAPADPTNLLLFEAIGGNGKSMLTWEWTKHHAVAARPADQPWAGRFWYSFYEHGAIMADFCQRALAYMTGRPLEEFKKKRTTELKDELIAQLHAKPWLIILDGLERVLVAYHRIDAAEVRDEEVNIPTDKIVNRNPTDAIRDEDNDLLRALAAAAPSKLLVSSRLTPRVLLNPAGQPIPGVKKINLPGLRPADAEALLRSCGVQGNSAAIRTYLTTNCDNHPLVIGILAGLIANYLPARGDFDKWSTATDGGAALDLASVKLTQRRNDILRAAMDALPDTSRQLLSTLALLTESVDYETLKAFNPHLPPEPEEVAKPEAPEKDYFWSRLSDEQKAERQKQYETALVHRQEYKKAVQTRLASSEFHDAPKKLAETVRDLEQRGLLQWDGRVQKYDLHPVVRGVASGGMEAADRERHGQRVVDHFSAQPHRPYEEAETMEDVQSGLHVVRTLLKLGRFQQAADAFSGDLASALVFNLNAYEEVLTLLKPFFPASWDKLPSDLRVGTGALLAIWVAGPLDYCDQSAAALAATSVFLRANFETENWNAVATALRNISNTLRRQNRFARALQIQRLALDLAMMNEDKEGIFMGRLFVFGVQCEFGQWAEAAATWQLLDPMGRKWRRAAYRPGTAELSHAYSDFWQGHLQEAQLAEAEQLAAQGKNRDSIRHLHRLRGQWRLEQGEWALAAASYQDAVRMARERSLTEERSETGLALAKHHLGQLTNPREEAERLAQLRQPAHRYLAMLWLAIGDPERAKQHALAAYQWAWADGEPYVRHPELTKTAELLLQMNVPIPNLPPYDPAKDEPLPWEADVRAAIEKLRAKKAKEDENTKKSGG